MIHYVWEVKMIRYDHQGSRVDASTFSVAAQGISAACKKGIKQAQEDSGVKTEWKVVSAVRGSWLVA